MCFLMAASRFSTGCGRIFCVFVMPLLTLDQACLSFGHVALLDHAHLLIDEGEDVYFKRLFIFIQYIAP